MDNLWNRRTNTGKLSLSTSGGTTNGASGQPQPELSSRSAAFPKRNGGDTYSRSNPFNMTPAAVASPTSASSAFGLGSGAFASFGAAKTPKTPGASIPFEASLGAAAAGAKAIAAEKVAKEKSAVKPSMPERGAKSSSPAKAPSPSSTSLQLSPSHPLRYKWVFWFRPPISKANGYIDYEKTLHPIAYAQTVEQFFLIYSYLKRPSDLPQVSDYHLFRDGIRPIWEDDVNRKGGKWIVRLKKGVADRYWEDLLFAIIGDQFLDASEEVCGVVLSVRNGEDILSIWTKGNNGRVLKIRETMKHVLNFPPDTKVDWKSHDESIQQRTAIEESRREKAHHSHHHNNHRDEKRSNQKDGQKA